MVFDNLIQLEHVNIVKFHRYWVDKSKSQPRVSIIILEKYHNPSSKNMSNPADTDKNIVIY